MTDTEIRYQTVAYCVDPGCRCDDRAGIILYDGPDADAAGDAIGQAPHGYAVVAGRVPLPEPKYTC